MRTRGSGALPNLLVIGALKAGTTSLHNYLRLHPEIWMSEVKELDYFIDQANLGRGVNWYRSQFDPAYRVRGESSPRYAMRPATEPVAERIKALLPDVRVIYMVRDPIERTVSHYRHRRIVGAEFRSLEEALSVYQPAYIEFSRYRYQLEPFLRALGQERILVLAQEELRTSRRAALIRAFSFLGVDPGFDSPLFEREWMVSEQQGGTLIAARKWASRLGVRSLWPRLPASVRNGVTRRLSGAGVGGTTQRPQLSEELRERLADALAPEAEALRALTGEAFSAWSV